MRTSSTSRAKRTWVSSGRRRRPQLATQPAPLPRPQAAPKTRPSPPAIGPAPPEGQRNLLVAWDPVTQKERWHASGGGALGGGTVSTAGNLVLQVIPDGRLVAYRADTGEKLLDLKTGLHGGMGPPITYMIDGKQYVSLMGGTGKVIPSVGSLRCLHPPRRRLAQAVDVRSGWRADTADYFSGEKSVGSRKRSPPS